MDRQARSKRIEEIKAELRIINNTCYVKKQNGSGAHARHKAKFRRLTEELKGLLEEEKADRTPFEKLKDWLGGLIK